ncbi:14221_t:CDS:2, partial [Funneliformis geosporum]
KPARQMTPAPMMIVKEMCENFVTSFVDRNIQNTIPDKLIHDRSWKESEEKIADVIKEVLILLEDIWINPAFNSELAKSLNEGTYQSTKFAELAVSENYQENNSLRPNLENYSRTLSRLENYCGDSVEDPGIRRQDVIPHYIHPSNQIGGLNTAGEFQGKTAAEIGRIGAGVATGADIILNGTWDEDWSIAGGEPVDNAPVAPNASGGLPAVTIAPGIKLGQLLYLFRTAYTTVEHLKQTAVFGQLMQGDMSVEQFSARIKKVAKSFQETMSRATKTLDNSKKSANKRGENLIIRRFLSELLRGQGKVAPGDDYDYDPVDDLTDSMAGMTLN